MFFLVRDRRRSEVFAEQLSKTMSEHVRGQDSILPVDNSEEEERCLLRDELVRILPNSLQLPEEKGVEVRHFQLGHVLAKESGELEFLAKKYKFFGEINVIVNKIY